MTVPLENRPVLPVPHSDLRLADGRRLKLWGPGDPRRFRMRGNPLAPFADFEGWDGPQQLIVLCTLDLTHLGPLLHASVSYQKRDPTWADLKAVRYAIFPRDIDVMCVLPRDELYVSGVEGAPGGMDSHVFHLSQTPQRWEML
jgi:hypothetical protein